MVKGKGTSKPYVKFLGAASTGVTQSCHLVRFNKYAILLDCGIYQEGDIATNYKKNRELLKKIKAREIDYIICEESHADHSALIPALYAQGCQAHLIVPSGSTPFLRVLWEDSMKIMIQDCQKLNNKHNIKVAPLYGQNDIEIALDRCVEIEPLEQYDLTQDMILTFYPANHIIHACQVSLKMFSGYQTKVLNFTGDIGGELSQSYVEPRVNLPKCNVLIAENTYNQPKRINKSYDRQKDREKIASILNEYKRVLFPVFALGRCQTILIELYKLWKSNKIPDDIKIYVDSPMAEKMCHLYPSKGIWDSIMNEWPNLKFIGEYTESVALQQSNEPICVLSSAGMITGGRCVGWAKAMIPDSKAHIVFCGYSSENSIASQIRYGAKEILIDGELVNNRCNITELVSFSSHASYEELMDYYNRLQYDKIALVHGNMEYKPHFSQALQQSLINQGKSARVICTNADTKIYI